MQHILVTGGAGFIGSHLVDRLLAQQDTCVTVIDSFDDFYDPAIKRANLAPHAANPALEVIEADIRDTRRLEQVFSAVGFDAVVHLAARAGIRPSLDQAPLYAEVNVNGTLNLLELARRFSLPRFILGSSSSVYGPDTPSPFREDASLAPISPYAATKASAEMFAHVYSRLYNLQVVCLRFFTVYGARQRPDLAIHKFARLITAGHPIPIYGDGSSERDYTYIDDIIDGIMTALGCDSAQFEIINLGESRTVPLYYLIELLENALGKNAVIERLPEQPGDMPCTHADISKAERLLHYHPSTTIEAGIRKFIEWFVRQPLGA
jgi:UDP-glucuronate 4-epimerase